MQRTTLLVTVCCLIDEWLAGQRLRQRGPKPTLADREVLTIECVGEFVGIDTDSGLDQYFRRHWAGLVPGPAAGAPHQRCAPAAILWASKGRLHRQLLTQVDLDPPPWLVGSAAAWKRRSRS